MFETDEDLQKKHCRNKTKQNKTNQTKPKQKNEVDSIQKKTKKTIVAEQSQMEPLGGSKRKKKKQPERSERKKKGKIFGPATSGKKTGQRAVDAFYTKPSVAEDLVDNLLDLGVADADTVFVEPSAGEGAFVVALLDTGVVKLDRSNLIAMDIQPSSLPLIDQRDFLSWTPETSPLDYVVFGNPPFGKNASTAVLFFNHAAKFAEAIAFIVPRSFLKPSIENKLDTRFEKISEKILPLEVFEFEGKPYKVPTVWQVWTRLPKDTRRVKKSTDVGSTRVEFGKPGWSKTTVLIQRVGQRAGQTYWNPKDWERYNTSRNYHWVLISGLNSREKEYLKDRSKGFESIPGKYNTAGMPSLSRSEVSSHIKQLLVQFEEEEEGRGGEEEEEEEEDEDDEEEDLFV